MVAQIAKRTRHRTQWELDRKKQRNNRLVGEVSFNNKSWLNIFTKSRILYFVPSILAVQWFTSQAVMAIPSKAWYRRRLKVLRQPLDLPPPIHAASFR